jgi:small-conductance mechanosensitive channel
MREWFANPLVFHLAVGAAIVAAFWILTGVLRWALTALGRRVFARTETVLDDRILEVALSVLRPLMLMIGLRIAAREVRKGVEAGNVTLDQVLDYTEAILYVVIAILIVRVLLGILRVLIHWYLDKLSSEGTSNLKHTLGPLTTKVTNILVGLVGIIIILDHFGINIGSLLVSLGVGSLAVALAAQDTLANMIAGFVILVDRPFRVGDRIELSTGQVGDVSEIGLRSTKMMNFDNNLIIIPNAELVKGRIVNYSYPHLPMRVLLRFAVALGTDVERVRSVLLGLCAAHPNVLQDPPAQAVVTGLSDTAVELTLIARASSYATQWGAETQLRERAYQAFLEHGISAPVPRRIVQVQEQQAHPA